MPGSGVYVMTAGDGGVFLLFWPCCEDGSEGTCVTSDTCAV